MTQYVLVVYVSGLIAYVSAFYNGAAHVSCQSFDPGPNHGFQGPDPVPYSIDILSGSTYTDGMHVTIKISGEPFTGIILQARRRNSPDWRPVGWFAVPYNYTGLRLMACVDTGDTITQTTGMTKLQDTVITWIAPERNVGQIEFKANVFKEMNVWYNMVTSSYLTYIAPSTTTTTTSLTTTPTTPTTTTTNYWPTFFPAGCQSVHLGLQTSLAILLASCVVGSVFGFKW